MALSKRAKGGQARALALTPKQRQAIAIQAANARWAKERAAGRVGPKQPRPLTRKELLLRVDALEAHVVILRRHVQVLTDALQSLTHL